jgi:cytochrome c oxidase subunit II
LRRGLAAIALGAALVAAGCGTGGRAVGGNATSGKELFLKKGCAGCHTLKDAGSKGTQGPNLDDAFRYAREQHFDDSTVADVVWDQIKYASGAMPRDLARGQDAKDIAAYVAQCAARTCNIQVAVAAPGGGKGAQLFSSLGCQGCHSLSGAKGIGPALNGVFGSQVKLTNGQTVTGDEAYLLDSIEDPDAKIAAGYKPGVMSAAIKPHSVSKADAQALVNFLKQQK